MNSLLMGPLLGIAVGLILGLTGAGGSVLAVPLLVAGYGWTLPRAGPVALIAVAASALLGTFMAWRHSYVRYRAASLMGIAGALSSPLGLLWARHAPERLLTGLFAGVMTIIALRMLRQALWRPSEAPIERATVYGDGLPGSGHMLTLNHASGRLIWTPLTFLVIGGIGAATGVLSGLLGVGGGFVIVPALRAVSPLSMHSAVATSLMTIAIVATATVTEASFAGAGLAWAQALPFAAGALLGMAGGRAMTPRIVGARLEEAFAALLLLVAAGLAGRAMGFW